MNHISKCFQKSRSLIALYLLTYPIHRYDSLYSGWIKNGIFMSPFGLYLLWLSFPKTRVNRLVTAQNPLYAYPSITDLSLKLCPPHNCHDFQRILFVATEKMIMFILVPTSFWSTWRDAAKLKTGHTRAVTNEASSHVCLHQPAAGVGMNELDLG